MHINFLSGPVKLELFTQKRLQYGLQKQMFRKVLIMFEVQTTSILKTLF